MEFKITNKIEAKSIAINNNESILANFRDLQVRGPQQDYFPEQTKSILVVAL